VDGDLAARNLETQTHCIVRPTIANTAIKTTRNLLSDVVAATSGNGHISGNAKSRCRTLLLPAAVARRR
jgi:hypothetical protein